MRSGRDFGAYRWCTVGLDVRGSLGVGVGWDREGWGIMSVHARDQGARLILGQRGQSQDFGSWVRLGRVGSDRMPTSVTVNAAYSTSLRCAPALPLSLLTRATLLHAVTSVGCSCVVKCVSLPRPITSRGPRTFKIRYFRPIRNTIVGHTHRVLSLLIADRRHSYLNIVYCFMKFRFGLCNFMKLHYT